jgi:hypothetical protein
MCEERPVAVFVTVMDAFGTAAPLGSWIVPLIEPEPACANAVTPMAQWIDKPIVSAQSTFNHCRVRMD